MKVKIRKWGNSLALRIPRSFAAETGITAGSIVEITMERGSIVIKPAKDDIHLEDLLSGITAENLHREVDFGKPEGREIL